MHEIFISYKRRDYDKVSKIKRDIEREINPDCKSADDYQRTCWIDLHGIESSGLFTSELRAAIDNCKIFLFMHSDRHNEITDFQNDWTIKELSYAQSEKKRIVVINIDNSPVTKDLKLLFGPQQLIDIGNKDLSDRLYSDLRKWLGVESPIGSRSHPESISTGSKKWIKYIVAGVVATIVVVAGFMIFSNRNNVDVEPEKPIETVETYMPEDSSSVENIEKITPTIQKQETRVDVKVQSKAEEKQAVEQEVTLKPTPKTLTHQELQELGDSYYSKEEYSKAVEYYTQAAELGNASAQASLGDCYLVGNGVAQNYAKAVEWYTKAAAQGNPDAQYTLGLCYSLGEGVEENPSMAIDWFTKAATQGHVDAQYTLGLCYALGEGVEEDIPMAITWLSKAADQGHEKAKIYLEELSQIQKG